MQTSYAQLQLLRLLHQIQHILTRQPRIIHMVHLHKVQLLISLSKKLFNLYDFTCWLLHCCEVAQHITHISTEVFTFLQTTFDISSGNFCQSLLEKACFKMGIEGDNLKF